MPTFLFFLVFMLSCVPRLPVEAPVTPEDGIIPRALLVEDLRQLVSILESSHPDPFTRCGGRVPFMQRVHDLELAIPPEGASRDDFFRSVRQVAALVRDGHTYLYDGRKDPKEQRLALDLEPLDHGLVISRVYDPAFSPLLGAFVRSVDGVSITSLAERMGTLRGYDNEYGNLVHLAHTLGSPTGAADLLETHEDLPSLLIQASPQGTRVPFGAFEESDAITPPSRVELPAPNAADLAWSLLTPKVAYLRIDSMMRYREAFEVWRSTGFTANLGAHLDEVATRADPSSLPATVDERIARVPSATATFVALFDAMREAGAEALIVDLRRNGGGNSLMGVILQYFLVPMDRIIEADSGYQIPRYSALYLENYPGGTSVADLASKGLVVGDLDFTEAERWRRRQQQGLSDSERSERLAEYEQWISRIPTFHEEYLTRTHAAQGLPRLVVLSSAATYSAGFDMAVDLHRLGATIVGVPSSQAGNCFIDTLVFQLDHSGIRGNTSFKASYLFPDAPDLGILLTPQEELTSARFAALGQDPNAAVMMALEMLERE